MFWRKHKKPLFGGTIEPSCSYCQHNGGNGTETMCTLRLEMREGKCKGYQYDPLMREPRPAPALKTAQFREEDFKL